MPVAEQTTTVDWEKRYKDEQAELTKLQQWRSEKERELQELNALREARQRGELVDKAAYDQQWQEHIRRQALENTDGFLASLGPEFVNRVRGSNGAGGTPDQSMVSATSPSGYGDEIFDESSEAHKRYIARYGQDGYAEAAAARWAPLIAKHGGFSQQIDEFKQLTEAQKAQIEELSDRLQNAERYATAAWHESRVARDPNLEKVFKLHEQAEKDPDKFWSEHLKLMEKAELYDKAQEKPAAPVVSAEDQAARIREAEATPAGAGSASGAQASRPVDKFQEAVEFAKKKLGLPPS